MLKRKSIYTFLTFMAAALLFTACAFSGNKEPQSGQVAGISSETERDAEEPGSSDNKPGKIPGEHLRAQLTGAFEFCWDTEGEKDQPYLVAVNRSHCTVTVYGKDEAGDYTVPVKAMACSVGREGHETITGRYNTTDRFEWCYMVDGSYGRYAIRIKGGYMFHTVCYFTKSISDLEYEEYNKLGEPASLGCIRLCLADEKWLYDNCPRNFPCVIYDDFRCAGPLGKPKTIKIDPEDEERRGWDPTDPERPWASES